jgi:4-hydroxy-tetrahydrodipicolinate synthase
MNNKLSGSLVPLVTPLREDHSVCEESVRRLIESVSGSAAALLPSLSSGEGSKLSRQQWQDMVVFSVRHSRGLPVFPGALVDAADELRSRAKFAADAGAAGVTLLVPSLAGNGARQAVDHFTQLIKSLPLPVFLYNQESEAADDQMVEGLAALCRTGKVVALKESSRRPEIVKALLRQQLPSSIFQGWEDLCYQSQGSDGNALALANLEPALCASIHREPTEEKQQSIIALCEKFKLFDDAWYVPLKAELRKRGILATDLAAAA